MTQSSLSIKLDQFRLLAVVLQRRTVPDDAVVRRMLTNQLAQPVPRRRDVIAAPR